MIYDVKTGKKKKKPNHFPFPIVWFVVLVFVAFWFFSPRQKEAIIHFREVLGRVLFFRRNNDPFMAARSI